MVKFTAPQWATFAKKNKSKKNEKKPEKKKASKKVQWANEKGGNLASVRIVTPVGRMTKLGPTKSTTRMPLTIKERLALGDARKRSALVSVRRDLEQANHDSAAAKKKLASDVRNLNIARSMKLGGSNIAKFENAAKKSEDRLVNAEMRKNLAKMKSASTRKLLL